MSLLTSHISYNNATILHKTSTWTWYYTTLRWDYTTMRGKRHQEPTGPWDSNSQRAELEQSLGLTSSSYLSAICFEMCKM